ncbi:MAG: hypothetical protein MN733_32225 [Nitrososphaera sp.]|nr:hypothetical protein [Nitrososphaera sp.]
MSFEKRATFFQAPRDKGQEKKNETVSVTHRSTDERQEGRESGEAFCPALNVFHHVTSPLTL